MQQLAATTNPPPLVRLAYAELLRRLRRFDEARRQLDDLAAEGFDEPDLFLHRAQLARSEHADTIAETWLQQGRQRFPQATELARFQAEWWLERQRVRDLSAMLTDPRAAVWAHPDFLAAAWTELEPDRREAILGSAAWWFNWQWLPWERLEARALAALDRRAALALGPDSVCGGVPCR